jgi:hypothetical protein
MVSGQRADPRMREQELDAGIGCQNSREQERRTLAASSSPPSMRKRAALARTTSTSSWDGLVIRAVLPKVLLARTSPGRPPFAAEEGKFRASGRGRQAGRPLLTA